MSILFQSWNQYEYLRRLLLAWLLIVAFIFVGIALGAAVVAMILLGSLILLFTITSYIPKLLSDIVAKLDKREPKPITDQEKIDRMLASLNYEHEREKSKGTEGESYVWQRRG